MRQLDLTGTEVDRAGLAVAYAYPEIPPRGWWLRANMVSTVDGAAVAPNGVTRGISSAADRDLLGMLRALADVVIVGSSTATKERYGPEKARPEDAAFRAAAGQPPHATLALVSSGLDLDPDAALFREADTRTLVLTTASAPPERLTALEKVADVIVAGDTVVDPKIAIAALAERGHRRMLCEGGPRWLAALAAAGVLDELCVTMSAKLLGGDAFRILRGGLVDAPLELAGVLAEGSDLFLRYRVAGPS
ncbi:MAG TPA: dihydrofolate reductase family protein [Sporichthyaceae bacterium]|nr:dihydrofolate reductase family protein [Sporichthyaceae bacterium]